MKTESKENSPYDGANLYPGFGFYCYWGQSLTYPHKIMIKNR